MASVQVKLQQFEGPLPLLLQLIEQEKLSINDISLAAIAEQFLNYLSTVEEKYPDELADFLVVATKLLLLKSRTLLPYLELDEEEEEGSLEQQLKLYKEFLEASKVIQKWLDRHHVLYSRPPSTVAAAHRVFSPPLSFRLERLPMMMEEILNDLRPVIALPRQTLERAISMQEKIQQIQQRLTGEISLSFKKLVQSGASRTEIIVTFLALLELVKQRIILARQDHLFSDIAIERLSPAS